MRKLEQLERQRQLKMSRKFIEAKKKWEDNIVKKIDLAPADIHYYDKYSVQPGFEFFMNIVSASQTTLDKLHLNIPDMIYVNYNAYLITTDVEMKKIKVVNADDPNTFLNRVASSVNYDPELHWNQPCAVIKKKTSQPCYTMSKLLDWKQTEHQIIVRGLKNYQGVQKFIKSMGD